MASFGPMSSSSLGALFGLAAYATYSTHDVVIKELGATYSPFQIVFFSALLGFPLITVLMIRDQKPGVLWPKHPGWIALRSVSGVVSSVCAFYAFGKLPLTQVYAFIFAMPLIITVLAVPLLGETIRLRRGLAVALGLVGVMIVLRPGAAEISSAHIAALASAFAGAMTSIIVRKVGSKERGVVMVLYPTLANLVLTAVALPFVYQPMPLEHLGLLAIVAALVLVAMAFLVAAYTRGDAMVVAPTQYSQIIWGVLFGAVLFGEYPDWQTYAGTAVIVVSGVYILKRESTRNVSQNAPVLNTRTRLGHAFGLRVGWLLKGGRSEE